MSVKRLHDENTVSYGVLPKDLRPIRNATPNELAESSLAVLRCAGYEPGLHGPLKKNWMWAAWRMSVGNSGAAKRPPILAIIKLATAITISIARTKDVRQGIGVLTRAGGFGSVSGSAPDMRQAHKCAQAKIGYGPPGRAGSCTA